MSIQNLSAEISRTTYPGRGIIIGTSADGANAVVAYFIMGRSENSRNRIFVTEGTGIRTQAFDQAKLKDPSLVIYAPVRVFGTTTIVTNGDQTDTVYEGLSRGLSFEQALRSREFEPDSPNFTPRISGVVNVENGKHDFALSILKSDDGDAGSCNRFTFSYEHPRAGIGRFIHTYEHDGNPLPSFCGEPVPLALTAASIDDFASEIWNSLNAENKVSLFVRYISIATGTTDSRILNKNS